MPITPKLIRAVSAFKYNPKQAHTAGEYQEIYEALGSLAERVKSEKDKSKQQEIDFQASEFIQNSFLGPEQAMYFIKYFLAMRR